MKDCLKHLPDFLQGGHLTHVFQIIILVLKKLQALHSDRAGFQHIKHQPNF